MNCIILLLLLSCSSGWGNSGGCCNGRNSNGGCGECRRDRGPGRRPERRIPDRGQEECCCEEEMHSHNDCGCDNCERERENCDVSGMIPPPWQEYPGLPRRESKNDENCDTCG